MQQASPGAEVTLTDAWRGRSGVGDNELVSADQRQSRHSREAETIAQVTARLRDQFPEVPAGDIDALVQGRYGDLAGSKIRDFVPILVERGVKQELADRRPSPPA